MADAPIFGLKYFSPSSARSIFFQEYCEMNGVSDLDDLDSVASVMGNSSRTLLQNYAPLRKKKLAQRLINEKAHFASVKFQSSVARSRSEGGRDQAESGPSGLQAPAQSHDLDPVEEEEEEDVRMGDIDYEDLVE